MLKCARDVPEMRASSVLLRELQIETGDCPGEAGARGARGWKGRMCMRDIRNVTRAAD